MTFSTIIEHVNSIIADKKAQDVFVSNKCSFADSVFIATVSSNRQMAAIVDDIRKINKKAYVEGLDTDWALIEINGVLVHLLKQEARTFYHLEDIYKTKTDKAETVL